MRLGNGEAPADDEADAGTLADGELGAEELAPGLALGLAPGLPLGLAPGLAVWLAPGLAVTLAPGEVLGAVGLALGLALVPGEVLGAVEDDPLGLSDGEPNGPPGGRVSLKVGVGRGVRCGESAPALPKASA